MTTINNETKVRALLSAGKSSEAILDYLVMNDDYRTKAEARPILDAFIQEQGLAPAKKIPMSEQYETWYLALSVSDKRTMIKSQLKDKAVEIGMSGKSADWYARVYELAGRLALSIYNEAPADEAPADEAPAKRTRKAKGERHVL